MIRHNILTSLFGVLCVCLAGCGSISSCQPLGSGYLLVTETQNSISEPSAHGISLQFLNSDRRRVVVWPSAGGVVVRNDVAIFVGDKAWKQQPFGERWPMKPRLFAVRAPETPLDITDEVLWRWSKQSGRSFTELSGKDYTRYARETNNALELSFFIVKLPDWEALDTRMDWDQVSDVMREVKEKGIIHKDLRWGTTYVEKEYKLEEQK